MDNKRTKSQERRRMANKAFKEFQVATISDACEVLGVLLTATISNLNKYKEYFAELDDIIVKCDGKMIPANVFDPIHDKLMYRQHELLKYLADEQKTSFSYLFFREKIINKKYNISQIPEKIKTDLNDLLDVRNWTFHFPQSQLVAAREVAIKGIPDDLKEMVSLAGPQLNPLVVSENEYYDFMLVASFYIHTMKRISVYDGIVANMISDYNELYNLLPNKNVYSGPGKSFGSFSIVHHKATAKFEGSQNDIAQISMAIQKSKYDGTDEAFKREVVRLDSEEKSKG